MAGKFEYQNKYDVNVCKQETSLYADDLVIFSRSAKSLQIILNKLESFCENADLSVNLDKTKIMIFVSSAKHRHYEKMFLLRDTLHEALFTGYQKGNIIDNHS